MIHYAGCSRIFWLFEAKMKHSPRVHVEVRSCNKLRPKYVFFQRQWTSMVSHWINKINFDTFYTNFWKDDPDSYSRCVYVSCCFIHDPVFRTTLNIKKTTWNYYTIMELQTWIIMSKELQLFLCCNSSKWKTWILIILLSHTRVFIICVLMFGFLIGDLSITAFV